VAAQFRNMAKTRTIPAETRDSVSLEDEESFELVLMTYWDPILRTLTHITGDHSQAEDLTIETFWRFWQHPPEHHHHLKAWLFRVAVNLGYNTIRSSRRRVDHETNAGKDMLHKLSPTNPEMVFDQNLERQQVRLTLSQMKPREAKILVLRHSGHSYRQISEILKIPASSVGQTLLRAEKRFRYIYENTGMNKNAS